MGVYLRMQTTTHATHAYIENLCSVIIYISYPISSVRPVRGQGRRSDAQTALMIESHGEKVTHAHAVRDRVTYLIAYNLEDDNDDLLPHSQGTEVDGD